MKTLASAIRFGTPLLVQVKDVLTLPNPELFGDECNNHSTRDNRKYAMKEPSGKAPSSQIPSLDIDP